MSAGAAAAAPPLLAGKRRGLALLLGVLALGEALLAVLFASALDRVLAAPQAPVVPLLAAGGCAAMIAAALLLARWVGEDFAQSYVADCRAAIFAAVIRTAEAGGGEAGAGSEPNADARWLTVLLNDMAALRNYALRGTVRLWTSALAAGAAAAWIAVMLPGLAPALLPLLLGAGAVLLMVLPLARAITGQRQARGALNRFLVRRVRAELAGTPSAKGHGWRKLGTLSDDVARASVRRARSAGLMDAAAALAGLAAALMVVWDAGGAAMFGAGLAGSLTLLGFIAARLLEVARALHARASGQIALIRLAGLLVPERSRARTRPRRAAKPAPPRRGPLARWLTPWRFSLNPKLPAPAAPIPTPAPEPDA